MSKIFNWIKSIYEFYRYGGVNAIFITFFVSMIIVVPIVAGLAVYNNEKKNAEYREDSTVALEGCIDCKFTDYTNYYFYTCEGEEYWINRSTWISLNVSECK